MQTVFVFACALLVAAPALAQEREQQKAGKTGKVERPVEKVLKDLHKVNQMEIQMGRMAEQKGMSNDVKELGKELAGSHRDIQKQVMELARNKGIDLEREPMPTDRKVMELQAVRNEQFDRQFLSTMIDGHSDAIKELSRAPLQIEDPEVEALIQDVLPQLHDHYEQASTTLAKLGAEQRPRDMPEQRREPRGG